MLNKYFHPLRQPPIDRYLFVSMFVCSPSKVLSRIKKAHSDIHAQLDLTPPMKWPPFYIHDYFDAKGTIERSVQEKNYANFTDRPLNL